MEKEIKTYSDYNNIECPHCNEKQDYTEQMEDLVSNWGENSIKEFECQDCDKKFFIKEIVIRDW